MARAKENCRQHCETSKVLDLNNKNESRFKNNVKKQGKLKVNLKPVKKTKLLVFVHIDAEFNSRLVTWYWLLKRLVH